MQGGESAIPPPQQGFMHLGDSTRERASQQQMAPQNDDTNPAEALATGQQVQDLCPTPAAVLEAQGEAVAVTPEQQIRIQGEKGEEVVVFPPSPVSQSGGNCLSSPTVSRSG